MHLAKVALWSSFDWSPDGGSIVFVGENELSVDKGLYSVDVESGDIFELTAEPSVWYGAPAWSPTGHHIAYVAAIQDNYQQLYVMNVVTHEEVQVPESLSPDRVFWSPDGKILSYVKRTDQVEVESSLYLLNVQTGSLLVSEAMDSSLDYLWLAGEQSLLLNRLNDWNMDGRREAKLWLLSLETYMLKPVSSQFLWQNDTEQIHFTEQVVNFVLP